MSSKWRRDVPTQWLAEAVLEMVDHFGAASYETQKLEGHWRHGGVQYRDNLVRLTVPRRPKSCLKAPKGSLKAAAG